MYRNFGQGRHALGTYIVYIGGVEVPVNSVDIHFAIGGQDPAAVLSLAPHRLITRIGAEDRLEVQVFFLDQLTDPAEPTYRLLFEGSISGWAFQRDAVQVSVTVTTQGILNTLRALTAEYLTSVSALANFDTLKGTNIPIADTAIALPWKIIFFGIGQEATPELRQVKRPFDFIFNFLRLVFEIDSHKTFGSIPSAYFYGLYHLKHNIFNRFLPSPLLETTVVDFETKDAQNNTITEKRILIPVLDALQNQTVALSVLAKSATAQGFSIPAWDTLLQVLQQLYFEVQQLPAPPCVYADMDTGKDNFGSITVPAEERFGKRPDTEKEILATAITKPNWFFGAVPLCNVVFPAMVQEVHFEENYWAQPTRLIVNDNALFNFFGVSDEAFGPLLAFSSAYPEAIEKEILKRSYSGADPVVSGKNLLVWPEEFYKGIIEHSITLPEWLMFLTETQLADKNSLEQSGLQLAIAQLLLASKEFSETAEKFTADSKLADIAEKTSQLEERRKVTTEKEELENIDKQLKDLRDKAEDVKKTAASESKDFAEKKKTYLTKLEAILRSVDQSRLSEQVRNLLFSADGSVRNETLEQAVFYLARETRGSLYDIYRRYAAFEYWRLRSEQRAGALTTVFNPYIVPGFPIFVFEAAATGQHFFAYATDVRHELSPAGRYTQVNFTHVLLLSEYIELLLSTKKFLKGMQQKDRGTFLVKGISGYELARELYKGWYYEESAIRETSLDDLFAENQNAGDVALEKVFIEDLVSVPLNPIMHFALVTQTANGADAYFNALFWQFTHGHRDSVFNPLTMLNLIYYDAKTGKEIVNRLDSVMRYLLEEDVSPTPVEDRLGRALNYAAVRPVEKFLAAMDNYEQALSTIHRPVCSLSQYLHFIGNTNAVNITHGSYDRGLVAPVQLYDEPKECLRKYWYGVDPKFNAEDNRLVDPDVVTKLPRHRKDWAKRLLEYRTVVTKESKK